MAKPKNKICPACQQIFKGRANAVTCSERCRKRLQRARAIANQEVSWGWPTVVNQPVKREVSNV